MRHKFPVTLFLTHTSLFHCFLVKKVIMISFTRLFCPREWLIWIFFLLRQWQAVTVEYIYDECLALPLLRRLGSSPTLCVLNWNAVSLSNSEPLDGAFVSIALFKYLNFKWRASLVPAAAVIPAPLAYTIIVAVKRLVVGLEIFLLYTSVCVQFIQTHNCFFYTKNTTRLNSY